MDDDDFNRFFCIETFKEHHIPENLKNGSCRSVADFEKVERIGEGTYGIVYSAIDIVSKELYALKKIKMDGEKDGMSFSTLREINILLNIKHENVVNLREVVVGRNLNDMYLVMDYCEQDLATLIDNMVVPFAEPQIKCILQQFFKGIHFLHKSSIIHRDLKVSNMLINNDGIIKIADFGMARLFSNKITKMTTKVVTIWYRPPEVLFGADIQTFSTDMWSCGCIMAELLLNKPILPGKGEIQQIDLIIKLLGTPNENIWPDLIHLPLFKKQIFPQQPYNNLKSHIPWVSESCYRILNSLFVYDPTKRATAKMCFKSSYFTESPLPCDPCHIPILPRKQTMKNK